MPQPEQLPSQFEQLNNKPLQETEEPERKIETPEDLIDFGKQTASHIKKTSTAMIESNSQQIESVIASIEGASEHVDEKKTAVAEVNQEIADLATLTKGKIDALMGELITVENDAEKREKLAEKCQQVVGKIVDWAEKYDIDISHIKKLGGGFVNVVLLIETPDGKGYVAKAFVEEEEARVTKQAQVEFDNIAKNDEVFIPKVIGWIDEKTVISEKAEGKPIRKILEGARDNPEQISEALTAFFDLGATLASIHERTEKPLEEVELSSEDDNYRINAQKFIKHLTSHIDSGLLDIDDEMLENLTQKVDTITKGGFVSLIHGDAHLDQFFKAPDKSTLSIVDYDSIHLGDPMADVARSLSSIRDWSRKMNIPDVLLREVEKSFFAGYQRTRTETHHTSESEFDQAKILAYEGRLNLVQLKQFGKLREKLKSVLPENQTEADFYRAFENGEIVDMKAYGFDEKETNDIKELIAIRNNVSDIIQYLHSLDV